MRVLISAIHYPISAARYLADGFRRLGHQVVTVGPAAGGRLPWQPDTDFSAYAWAPDIETPNERVQYIDQHSQWFYREQDLSPDLLIQCDANFFLQGKVNYPNVCWAVDNHVAPYTDTHFDQFFGAHSWGYGSERDNFHWLPCAYDPQAHYQIKDAVKRFDAALIGNLYPQRQELVNALAPHGSILIGQGILGKEYNEAYNSARIAIVSSACGDVAMRVFENAAQGLALFCDDTQRDLDKLGLNDYMRYTSVSDAAQLFQWAVKHPDAVTEMAQRGKEQLARHTYEARAQEIIEVCKKRGLL